MSSTPPWEQSGPTPLVLRALGAIVGSWTGGVLANLIFSTVHAPRGTRGRVALILLAVGAILGWIENGHAGPRRAGDVRNGAIGWGVVVAIIATLVGAVLLPSTWGLAAGLGSFALIAIFAIQRSPAHKSGHD